jgi:hypothetical protein
MSDTTLTKKLSGLPTPGQGNARRPEALSRRPSRSSVLEGRTPSRVASVGGGSHRSGCVVSVQSRHWLDYDPVALVVLVVGMSAVALLALSI